MDIIGILIHFLVGDIDVVEKPALPRIHGEPHFYLAALPSAYS